MGACSSTPGRPRRVREAKPGGGSRRNAESAEKGGKDFTQTCGEIEHLGEAASDSALWAMGEILATSVDVDLRRVEETVGVGCMISSRILFASDHYLHRYGSHELSFRPFGSCEVIRVVQCLYPPASLLPKEKKRSMYMHKHVSSALFLLHSAPSQGGFLQLGTGVLQEQEQDSLQICQLKEKMICESSRSLYLHVQKDLPERGWPLLYKLFDKFYVIGLYSYPHTSDSFLLSDHLVQRFKVSEGKHCGTEEIASVDVSEAVLEIDVVVRQAGRLQDLLEELREVQGGQNEDIAQVAFRIGLQYGSLGNFPQEKEYYLSALQRYLSCSHPQPLDSIAALYHNLGICESELGDIPAARLHLAKSLQMKTAGADGEGEGESIADTYNQLGVVSRKEGRVQQALEFYYKAYRIYSQLDFPEKMGIVLNNINLLTQEDQTHSASEAKYRGVIAVLARTKGQNCIEVAEVLFNLGQMEAGGRNYGPAISHFAKAANVMKNLGLEGHCQYRRIVRAVEQVDLRARESGERKQWLLKSKALLDLL